MAGRYFSVSCGNVMRRLLSYVKAMYCYMWKCTNPIIVVDGCNAGPSMKDITHSSNQRRCRASRSSVNVDDTKSQSIHYECNSVNGLDLVVVLNQLLNHYWALNPLLLPINKQSVREPIDIEHSGLFENNQDMLLSPCVNFSGDGTQRRAKNLDKIWNQVIDLFVICQQCLCIMDWDSQPTICSTCIQQESNFASALWYYSFGFFPPFSVMWGHYKYKYIHVYVNVKTFLTNKKRILARKYHVIWMQYIERWKEKP